MTPAQPPTLPRTFVSACSGREFPLTEQVSGQLLQPALLALIRQTHPNFTADDVLAQSELNGYRRQYMQQYLLREVGELSALEQTVLDHLQADSTLSDKLEDDVPPLTLGQRLADQIAAFGGSWRFILLFFGTMLAWIGLNTWGLGRAGFDPYPFILLNLVLSCVAALQAPVIMMSQNRQEDKDRQRARKDYMINLKSELEIRMLHEKLDHLILHQQQDLLELQRIQVDMMNDILARIAQAADADAS
ncbi:DUF1003 domain-containing protein [Hymenobacter aquaticus]|uniref:DUF1003 domain-containing protein n=1 Tax=Hymenobacter aquaticus TaxID=1867101 RepID=A0A4Z0Q2R4_9BACT|nr:DUF1003 domain-containing protein [Hymenobacter aquaticus]TGE23884.1 DUF1003 domain-containing protein [Hymenobacter aquaticus]